jgi:hypothetical protein
MGLSKQGSNGMVISGGGGWRMGGCHTEWAIFEPSGWTWLSHVFPILNMLTWACFTFIRLVIALQLFYYFWYIIKFSNTLVNKSVFHLVKVHHTTAKIYKVECKYLMKTGFPFTFTQLQLFLWTWLLCTTYFTMVQWISVRGCWFDVDDMFILYSIAEKLSLYRYKWSVIS